MAGILIAEDEPDIRELVALLAICSHEVITTSNGEEPCSSQPGHP